MKLFTVGLLADLTGAGLLVDYEASKDHVVWVDKVWFVVLRLNGFMQKLKIANVNKKHNSKKWNEKKK